ncbi:MAG: hypothetical protein GY832_23715 [Chloroflexi bacterium]|nr:hypothetical protein [Chloroflexota bacterium]
MAALYSIVGLLREEVEGRIRDLTPTAFTEHPFKARPQTDRKEREVRACTGEDRLFEMGSATDYTNITCGHSTRLIQALYPITIVYRRTEDWERAALDDLEAISQDLRRNQSSVSGVEIREINWSDGPMLEPHEEDPWMYGLINLYAILRVS